MIPNISYRKEIFNKLNVKIFKIGSEKNPDCQIILKTIEHDIKNDKCLLECRQLKRENDFQYKNDSPYFLKHLTRIQKCQKFCKIYMEKADDDLFEYIFENQELIKYDQTIQIDILLNISKAILEVHRQKKSHNDIKLDNFFYFKKNQTIKLGDFGFCYDQYMEDQNDIIEYFSEKNKELLAPEVYSAVKTIQDNQEFDKQQYDKRIILNVNNNIQNKKINKKYEENQKNTTTLQQIKYGFGQSIFQNSQNMFGVRPRKKNDNF
ncbi:Protein kinase-like domain [Pseudocohnilembus persalinus]|uniref:Protein kinase-like domain n=1 Tax=Pseudocohnilembus persalinus TaxID=266149 RepID=A0A0V0QW42_PSEPJ|nr:Protein kinase-like domain [Pseudocohnilembus persalinus]|eukprot:KRX06420.1 Protein kinase-like domain [Pseudocohnilembus persalinus]